MVSKFTWSTFAIFVFHVGRTFGTFSSLAPATTKVPITTELPTTTEAQISCADIWDSTSNSTCTVPMGYINDDWCDCPSCEDEKYWSCGACGIGGCNGCKGGDPCNNNTHSVSLDNDCNFALLGSTPVIENECQVTFTNSFIFTCESDGTGLLTYYNDSTSCDDTIGSYTEIPSVYSCAGSVSNCDIYTLSYYQYTTNGTDKCTGDYYEYGLTTANLGCVDGISYDIDEDSISISYYLTDDCSNDLLYFDNVLETTDCVDAWGGSYEAYIVKGTIDAPSTTDDSAPTTTEAEISCADIWDTSSTSTCTIPISYINDDWCDCDGCEDEKYWSCATCGVDGCDGCYGNSCNNDTHSVSLDSDCNFGLLGSMPVMENDCQVIFTRSFKFTCETDGTGLFTYYNDSTTCDDTIGSYTELPSAYSCGGSSSNSNCDPYTLSYYYYYRNNTDGCTGDYYGYDVTIPNLGCVDGTYYDVSEDSISISYYLTDDCSGDVLASDTFVTATDCTDKYEIHITESTSGLPSSTTGGNPSTPETTESAPPGGDSKAHLFNINNYCYISTLLLLLLNLFV